MLMFLKVFRIWKEGSLTDDVFFEVEKVIEGLKPQVGHSHMVGIGIDETNGNFPAPWFLDSPFLFLKNPPGLLNEFPRSHFLQVESGVYKILN